MKFDIDILASQPVPTIVRQVQLAESLGYDTAWITDTHLLPQGPDREFVERESILRLFADEVMARV